MKSMSMVEIDYLFLAYITGVFVGIIISYLCKKLWEDKGPEV